MAVLSKEAPAACPNTMTYNKCLYKYQSTYIHNKYGWIYSSWCSVFFLQSASWRRCQLLCTLHSCVASAGTIWISNSRIKIYIMANLCVQRTLPGLVFIHLIITHIYTHIIINIILMKRESTKTTRRNVTHNAFNSLRFCHKYSRRMPEHHDLNKKINRWININIVVYQIFVMVFGLLLAMGKLEPRTTLTVSSLFALASRVFNLFILQTNRFTIIKKIKQYWSYHLIRLNTHVCGGGAGGAPPHTLVLIA